MKEIGFHNITRPNALTLANYPGVCDLLRAPCVRYGRRGRGFGWPGEIKIKKRYKKRKMKVFAV